VLRETLGTSLFWEDWDIIGIQLWYLIYIYTYIIFIYTIYIYKLYIYNIIYNILYNCFFHVFSRFPYSSLRFLQTIPFRSAFRAALPSPCPGRTRATGEVEPRMSMPHRADLKQMTICCGEFRPRIRKMWIYNWNILCPSLTITQ
jgi:hypothetical protein